MAKRRRRQVNWFPTFGQTLGEGTGNDHANGIWGVLPGIGTGPNNLGQVIFPLTFDEPRDDDVATPETSTMADFIGSGYFLNRIVGKFYTEYPWTDENFEPRAPGGPAAVKIGLGFFVAREADQTVGVPIGDAIDYNPLETDNMREPWIWRRTWVLSSPTIRELTFQAIAAGNAPYPGWTNWLNYPASTASYGSVLDGPHIDAKTKRVVTNDDRLWMVVAGLGLPFDSSQITELVDIPFHLDYRLLGSIIRAGRVRGNF